MLPLLSVPVAFKGSNKKSVFENYDFVISQLASYCVRLYNGIPYVCSPLLMVTNCTSGKMRLVINLRHLNTSEGQVQI